MSVAVLRRAFFSALKPAFCSSGPAFQTVLEATALSTVTKRSFSSLIDTIPGPPRRIAVGISGGVDSAVAAMLLKQAGHDVVGVFMRNWDEAEEKGNRNCSIEADLKDASAVCRQLGIPLIEADFVSQYWNQVFSTFLAECERGLTPNPDLACNRHIKFGALIEFAASLGADTVATGHYARLRHNAHDGTVQLLRGVDPMKDQSYFLASVHAEALQRVIFPLGSHMKSDVRSLASNADLVPAHKRSSAGICFIGRRNFADFLAQYVPATPGRYLDVDSGKDLGSCLDITSVTHGQRPGIGGAAERVYVAGKDVVKKVVYVASGRDHPALFTKTACLRTPHWLSRPHQDILERTGRLECQYKARYGQEFASCTLHVLGNGGPTAAEVGFEPSTFCGLHLPDSEVKPGYVVVAFDQPAMAITPQQIFVMYDGDLCLGSAEIAMPGKSLHEVASPPSELLSSLL